MSAGHLVNLHVCHLLGYLVNLHDLSWCHLITNCQGLLYIGIINLIEMCLNVCGSFEFQAQKENYFWS